MLEGDVVHCHQQHVVASSVAAIVARGAGRRVFVTDLGGSVYTARLDGSDGHPILFAQGNLSGVAYAELPPAKA